MPVQRKKSFLKSLILHAVLIGMIAGAITLGVKSPEKIVEVISLENISISRGVKKAVHTAVHAIGIPHDEPEAERESSKDASPASTETRESTPGGGISPSVLQQYLAGIRQKIEETKRYPRDARINGQEGVVGLRIRLAPDGTLMEVEVESPAMFPSLNEAALSAVKAHSKFPEIPSPAGARTEPITLHLPIRFILSP